MSVKENLPAGKQAFIPANKLAGLPVIFSEIQEFTLCLIKVVIVRYEEGEQIGNEIQKQHGGHQEYETK
jgi:hypothetical protein